MIPNRVSEGTIFLALETPKAASINWLNGVAKFNHICDLYYKNVMIVSDNCK
jgi:hypothetical protein